jgi:hypothetical protein
MKKRQPNTEGELKAAADDGRNWRILPGAEDG